MRLMKALNAVFPDSPGATVAINYTGTTTPASLFADALGATPVPNPVGTDANARIHVYVMDGIYDMRVVFGTTSYAVIGVEHFKSFDLRGFGARGDTQIVTDGAMSGGSAILTSASGQFAPGDVGKAVAVVGAGAAGATLLTTVASRLSATQVGLSASASNTVSGATVEWGTDDTAAIQSALNAFNSAANTGSGGTLPLSPGIYFVTASLQVYRHIKIAGPQGFRAEQWQDSGRGATFVNHTPNAPTLILHGQQEVNGLNFEGSGPGAYVQSVDNTIAVRNCAFRGRDHGIYANSPGSVYDILISDSIFASQSGDCIQLNTTQVDSLVAIERCWFRKVGGYRGRGINIQNLNGGYAPLVIRDCLFDNLTMANAQGVAISTAASQAVIIEGNHFESINGTGSDTIFLGGTTGAQITGNLFLNCNQGVRIGSSAKTFLAGNYWQAGRSTLIFNSDARDTLAFGIPAGTNIGTGLDYALYFDNGSLRTDFTSRR